MATFALGLALYGVAQLMLNGVIPGGSVIADLLYNLGITLWTSVVLAFLLEVLVDRQRKFTERYVRLVQEAMRRVRSRAGGRCGDHSAPLPPLYEPANTAFALLFLATIVGGLFVVLCQCWLRGKSSRHFWPAAIGLTLLWVFALVVIGVLGQAAPASMLPALQCSTYGYGAAFAFIGLMLVAAVALVVAGVIGGVVSGAFGRRRRGGSETRP